MSDITASATCAPPPAPAEEAAPAGTRRITINGYQCFVAAPVADRIESLTAENARLKAEAAKQQVATHRHYKGGLYRMIGRDAILTEQPDAGPHVVYANEAGEIFVRPQAMFDEPGRFTALPETGR